MVASAEQKEVKKLPLVEMFGPTIQGEGAVIGQQTFFFRFGLCDYKCALCDSLHAIQPEWVRQHASWLTQEEIFELFMMKHRPGQTRWVTFSGGNPCIHDLSVLVRLLKQHKFLIHVETQGTIWQEWLEDVDLITVSPKGPGMGETTDIGVLSDFLVQNTNRTEQVLKIVVFDQRDLDFARDIFNTYRFIIPQSNRYLSLGNPLPPDRPVGPSSHEEHVRILTQQYQVLFEDIMNDEILSSAKFLPQWHVYVWGNAKGK